MVKVYGDAHTRCASKRPRLEDDDSGGRVAAGVPQQDTAHRARQGSGGAQQGPAPRPAGAGRDGNGQQVPQQDPAVPHGQVEQGAAHAPTGAAGDMGEQQQQQQQQGPGQGAGVEGEGAGGGEGEDGALEHIFRPDYASRVRQCVNAASKQLDVVRQSVEAASEELRSARQSIKAASKGLGCAGRCVKAASEQLTCFTSSVGTVSKQLHRKASALDELQKALEQCGQVCEDTHDSYSAAQQQLQASRQAALEQARSRFDAAKNEMLKLALTSHTAAQPLARFVLCAVPAGTGAPNNTLRAQLEQHWPAASAQLVAFAQQLRTAHQKVRETDLEAKSLREAVARAQQELRAGRLDFPTWTAKVAHAVAATVLLGCRRAVYQSKLRWLRSSSRGRQAASWLDSEPHCVSAALREAVHDAVDGRLLVGQAAALEVVARAVWGEEVDDATLEDFKHCMAS